MGKFQETVNFHKRLQRHEWIAKKIPYPARSVATGACARLRQPREHNLNLVEVRNKYTKELVDLEVCFIVVAVMLLLFVCAVWGWLGWYVCVRAYVCAKYVHMCYFLV